MKQSILYLIIITLVGCAVAKPIPAPAQIPILRSNASVTVQDTYSKSLRAFSIPVWSDTSLRGGLDSLGSILLVKSGTNAGTWIRDSITTGGHFWNQFAPFSTNYWQLSGSNLYPKNNNYNVGIGGTPTHKFDVFAGSGDMFYDGTRLGLSDQANNIGIGSALTGAQWTSLTTDNVALGTNALRLAPSSNNIGIGTFALQGAGGSQNVAIGTNALTATNDNSNVGIGYLAGSSNYGTQNIAIGSEAGNYSLTATGTINNSEIVTSSASFSGATTATFISSNSLTTGISYSFEIVWNSTPAPPYTTGILAHGVITNSNTITLTSASFTGQGSGTFTLKLYDKQNNSIAIGYQTRTTGSNQIVLGNASSTLLKAGSNFIVDLTSVPADQYALVYNAGSGKAVWQALGGGGGGVTSVSGTSPINVASGTSDAVVSVDPATTSSTGVASFNTSDFIVSGAGAVSINYASGQAAGLATKGFLAAADYGLFFNKQAAITGALTPYLTSNATLSRAIVSDGSGKLTTSATTSTEIGYVSGVTSAIQTQLNAKISTTLNNTQILVGNGSNVATAVTVSGDFTLDNTGVATLKTLGSAGSCTSCNMSIDVNGRITAYADGTSGGGPSGTVTTVTATSPIIITSNPLVTPNVTIQTALADGATSGAAWFNANDFNSGSGGISLDYTNGQKATVSVPGYMTSAQVTTLNSAVQNTRSVGAGMGLTGGGNLAADRTISLNSINGFVAAGTNVTLTGNGTQASPYTINSSASGSVLSVGLSMPGGFTVTNSPVTSTGTLTVTTTLNGIIRGTGSAFTTTTISSPLTFSAGALGIQTASALNTGALTNTDWLNFNSKQPAATGWVTPVMNANLTSNRVVISDGTGKAAASTVLTSELNNLSGTTSNLQFLVLQYTIQNLTDGATITMNCNSGFIGKVTIAGNRTLAFSNFPAKGQIMIEVTQDATGGRTITLPANSRVPIGFGSGTSINLSTAGGATDILYDYFDGTFHNWTIAKQFQ